jgi:hypothetical protein
MPRLLIIALLCLLFASGCSPILAATFCTRGQGHDCCARTAAAEGHEQTAHHHAMAMDGTESPRPSHADDGQAGTSAAALEHPIKDCAHCATHSRLPHAPAVTFGATRSEGSDAASPPPQVRSYLFRAAPSPNLLVSSRPHAPPTGTSPRHLLLSLFLL